MQKITKLFLTLTLLMIITGMTSTAQVLSPAQKTKVQNKVDSIVKLYEKYSPFTQDFEKLTNSFFDKFNGLFKAGALVYDDLSFNEATVNQMITPAAYGELVKKYYEGGVGVELTNKTQTEPEFKNGVYLVRVKASKKTTGYHAQKGRLNKTYNIAFTLELSKQLDKVVIISIDNADLQMASAPQEKTQVKEAPKAPVVEKPVTKEKKEPEVAVTKPPAEKLPVVENKPPKEPEKQAENKVVTAPKQETVKKTEPPVAKVEPEVPKQKEEKPAITNPPKAPEKKETVVAKPEVTKPEKTIQPEKPVLTKSSNTFTIVCKLVDEKNVPLSDKWAKLEYEGNEMSRKKSQEDGGVTFTEIPANKDITITIADKMYEGKISGTTEQLAKQTNMIVCNLKESEIPKVDIRCRVEKDRSHPAAEAKTILRYRSADRSTQNADQKGEVTFTRVPKDYEVTITGYSGPFFGSVTGKAEDLSKKGTVVITLNDTVTYIPFKFIVTNEVTNAPLKGVRITLKFKNSRLHETTNSSGIALFNKVPAYNQFSYNAYKPGYVEVEKPMVGLIYKAQEVPLKLRSIPKPAFVDIHVTAGNTTMKGDDPFQSNEVTTFYGGKYVTKSAMGVGIDYKKCFFQSRKLEFDYGAGLGISTMKAGISVDKITELYAHEPNYLGNITKSTKIFGRNNLFTNLKEDITLQTIDIPVFMEMKIKLNRSGASYLYVRPGLLMSYSMKISSKSPSGTMAHRHDTYSASDIKSNTYPIPEDSNLPLDSLPEIYKKGFSVSYFASGGIAFSIFKNTQLFLGARLESRSFQGKMSDQTPFSVSKTKKEYHSPISQAKKLTFQNLGFELGFSFKL
ncbi:MAG: hypothetical protein NTU44_06265 [Bacteroidetes bacterium]|nr:hypothetical protein [Bacteroidota bacterium]